MFWVPSVAIFISIFSLIEYFTTANSFYQLVVSGGGGRRDPLSKTPSMSTKWQCTKSNYSY